ncbi:hypothetical protein CR513_59450, partial [Mucuna pruriens]
MRDRQQTYHTRHEFPKAETSNELDKQEKQRQRSQEKEASRNNAPTPPTVAPSLPYPEATLFGENWHQQGKRSTLCHEDSIICFTDEDYEGTLPYQDNPMVLSLIAVDYKIERVLIGKGSSTNVFYRSKFQKLGHPTSSLEECSETLVTSRDKRNGIDQDCTRGGSMCAIHTGHLHRGQHLSFLQHNHGCLSLNKLRAVLEDWRPQLVMDLKEVQIGPSRTQKTKIDATMDGQLEEHLTHFLTKNRDVFA